MAKVVNVSNLPVDNYSDELIKKANQEHVITDELGRRIKVKKYKKTMKFGILEVIGDTSMNYFASVVPLFCVTEIDNKPVGLVSNKAELNALINRLGDEGIEAVETFVYSNMSQATSEDEAKQKIKK